MILKARSKRAEHVLWGEDIQEERTRKTYRCGYHSRGRYVGRTGTYVNGTEEATEFSEEVHKIVACMPPFIILQMAKERGAFEIYSTERETNNPFINRLQEADPNFTKT